MYFRSSPKLAINWQYILNVTIDMLIGVVNIANLPVALLFIQK